MRTSTLAPGILPAVSGVSPGWLLGLGILMIVLGAIGLSTTYAFTTVVLFWIGILAVFAGVGQLLDAFHHKNWRGVVWHVIVGTVYILLGAVLTFMPTFSAFWLTIFIANALIITGVMRVLMMFQLRGHRSRRLLVLMSGLVSIGLGLTIYALAIPPGFGVLTTIESQRAWTGSWQWIVGVFVAIELIMEGVALISIALSAKPVRDG